MYSKLQWSQFSVSCIFILSLSISYVSLSSFSTFTSCTINLSIVSRFVVRILFTLVTPVTSSHLLFHQEGDHLVLTSQHGAPSVLHGEGYLYCFPTIRKTILYCFPFTMGLCSYMFISLNSLLSFLLGA